MGIIRHKFSWKLIFSYFRFRTRLSDQVKDLIHRCLQVDVSKRIKLQQILQHPWLLMLPGTAGDLQQLVATTSNHLPGNSMGGVPIPAANNNIYLHSNRHLNHHMNHHHPHHNHHNRQHLDDGLNSVGSSTSSPINVMETDTSVASSNASDSSLSQSPMIVDISTPPQSHLVSSTHHSLDLPTINSSHLMSSSRPVVSSTRHLRFAANSSSGPSAMLRSRHSMPVFNNSMCNYDATNSVCSNRKVALQGSNMPSVSTINQTVLRVHVIDHLSALNSATSASRPLEITDLVDKVKS